MNGLPFLLRPILQRGIPVACAEPRACCNLAKFEHSEVLTVRTVVLKVIAQGDDLLKIVWGEGGDTPLCFDPYFVFREQLKASVKDCRDAVEELVTAFLDRDPSRYAPALRALADQGASLYYLLFSGCARNPDTAKAVELWLANIEEPVRLIVSSDASIHVPWGLVFAGKEDEIALGSANIGDFRNFW